MGRQRKTVGGLTVAYGFFAIVTFVACPPLGFWFLVALPFFFGRDRNKIVAAERAEHQRRIVKREQQRIMTFRNFPLMNQRTCDRIAAIAIADGEGLDANQASERIGIRRESLNRFMVRWGLREMYHRMYHRVPAFEQDGWTNQHGDSVNGLLADEAETIESKVRVKRGMIYVWIDKPTA